MGQLKVRFTIEHRDEQNSFSSLSDLKQHSFSELVLSRLNDFEIRLKSAAADIWLQQKLGRDNHSGFQITMAQDDTFSELTDCTSKA
ncbi:hypothetical protein [Cohnella sp. WQ 127256]|uniref:hypothetical protein n=1 Tax=Cohnella sp. WQ 127256 TaxID=2938790 RepID=UPI002118F94C|nr:hypothetical protein [Cohnella sp. WQ 127256]